MVAAREANCKHDILIGHVVVSESARNAMAMAARCDMIGCFI